MNILSNRIFGSDPEFSIISSNKTKELNNNLLYNVPPMALIEDFNVKYTVNSNNKKVLHSGDNFSAIEDGAAIELNLTPVDSHDSFYWNFMRSFKSVLNFVHKISSDLIVSTLPVTYFDTKSFWKERDESFQECVIFGCDPDEFPIVYKDMGLASDHINDEIDVSEHTLRYFGGHLHVQNMSDNPDIYVENFDYAGIVYDFIVGLTNCSFNRSKLQKDLELKRLKYYGHPGRARIQVYNDGINGYEYRPLSNYWIQSINRVTSILNSAKIASTIIENNMGSDFFEHFIDYIPAMYRASLSLDKDKAISLLTEVVKYCFDNDIIAFKDVPNYFATLRDIPIF